MIYECMYIEETWKDSSEQFKLVPNQLRYWEVDDFWMRIKIPFNKFVY